MTVRTWWTVAAVAVLVALLVVTGPIALAVGAVWGLLALCVADTRRIRRTMPPERLRDSPGLRYNLSAFGVLYLVPIGVAATCYLLLAAYVRLFAGSVSVGTLVSLQRFFEAVSGFFSNNLKLSELSVFGVLIGVYLLTCVLLVRRRGTTGSGRRFRVASALGAGTERYTRYSGPVSAGLATLAAFSLFGMQAGTPATDLQLRLKVAQQGYAEVTHRIEADLSQRVASGLYAKVEAGFPQSYRDALTEPARIDDLVDSLRDQAATAKSTHGVSVPSVDRAVETGTAQRQRLDAAPSDLRVESPEQVAMPADVTPDQVEAARQAVRSDSSDSSDGKGVELVNDGHKKVTLQVEKVISEQILALTAPLTRAVPILDPLLQAFAEVADKTVQDRIGQAYDRMVELVMRNPRAVEAALGREAKSVVDHTDVRLAVHHATALAQRLTDSLAVTLASLRGGNTLIEQKVTATLAARRPPPPSSSSSEWPDGLSKPPDLPEIHLPPADSFQLPYEYLPGRYDPPNTYQIPRELINPPPVEEPRIVEPPEIMFW
jgi:hypothetical protein